MQQEYSTTFTGMLEFTPKLSKDGVIKKEMETFLKDPIKYVQQFQQLSNNNNTSIKINQAMIGDSFRKLKSLSPNCPLLLFTDGITIAPGNNNAVQYLEIFITLFLLPNDIDLNGNIDAVGSEVDDRWILKVKNSVISIVKYVVIVEKSPPAGGEKPLRKKDKIRKNLIEMSASELKELHENDGLKDYSLDDLKAFCLSHSKKTSGTKADLIGRIFTLIQQSEETYAAF